ncbi:MAG: hypothetical protein ACREND_15975 [Gemmatimonadaceae bacterium]
MVSLDGTIGPFASRLAPALVGAVALERVRTTAADLPAALSSRIYLECRGEAEAPQVDLIVGVGTRERSCLLSDPGASSLADGLRDAPCWRRARALAAAWANPGSPLHHAVRRLWLEFDLNECAGRRAIERPGIFIDFAPEVYARPCPAVQMWAMHEAFGGVTSGADRDALRRCAFSLPDGASVVYLGIFPERHPPAVRVCVAGLPVGDVQSFLVRAGWPGSVPALRHMLSPVAARAGAATLAQTVLHLDIVGDAIAARVGAEFGFARARQLHGPINECELLDTLVAQGWCSREKRRALDAWPGAEAVTLPDALWPALVTRHVNHVKIVGGDEAAPSVKLYLRLSREPLDALPWTAGLERALRAARRETTQHSIK